MKAMPRFRSGLDGIAWPPVPTGEGATIVGLVARLLDSEWQPAAATAVAQGEQLARLAAHHARWSTGFRARLQAAGLTPGSLADVKRLRELAPLTRQALQGAGRGFFASYVPESHGPVGETITSGSTGEPVAVKKTTVTRLMWAACTIRDHLWHERDFAGGLVVIRPAIPDGAMATWGFPVADVFATGPALAMPGNVGIEEQVRRIDRFRPEHLLCFPSNLQALADVWTARPEGPPPSIRHLRTVGANLSLDVRARVTRQLGMPIEDNYSSQEAGIIAVQCPHGDLYHTMAETLIVEVLRADDTPCAEGEVGRVVVTHLHNFASPIVRYDIGDYAEVGGPCPCGRTLPTLRRVLGRKRNLLMRADGTRYLPRAGFESFAAIAPVQQYQVIQHALHDIEFKLVTAEPLTAAQEEAFIAVLRGALEVPGGIRLTQSRERLPGSVAGKFEDFVCLVPAAG